MGFWDTVGKAAATVGKAAVDSAKEGMEKQRQFKDEYAHKTDSELFEILVRATRNRSIAEGGAVRSILQSRGYSSEDISAQVRSQM